MNSNDPLDDSSVLEVVLEQLSEILANQKKILKRLKKLKSRIRRTN
jgi:hypothetical protein